MENIDDFDRLSDDERLLAEIELLRLKLQAEFGMKGFDIELEPQVEHQLLQNLYNLEKQLAEKETCSLRELLGSPQYPASSELSVLDLKQSLAEMKECMHKKGVELIQLHEYSDTLMYDFIRNELFEVQVPKVQVERLSMNFIYEEFHPNHDFDLRKIATEFIQHLFARKEFTMEMKWLFAQAMKYHQKEFSREAYLEMLELYQQSNEWFKLEQWEITNVFIQLEKNFAHLDAYIEYQSALSKYEGLCRFNFTLEDDYWQVHELILPGFSD